MPFNCNETLNVAFTSEAETKKPHDKRYDLAPCQERWNITLPRLATGTVDGVYTDAVTGNIMANI